MRRCSNRACDFEAVSTVFAGAVRVPVCFHHEREYVDRYGHQDVLPLRTAIQEEVLAKPGQPPYSHLNAGAQSAQDEGV